MKIKIVAAGWAGFNGYLGATEFRNGVSVHEVGKIEAQRLAAVVQIETLEGKDPSAAQEIIDSRTVPMDLATTPELPASEDVASVTYTAAELEAIADKQGIKGLREIADKYDVRGKSIAEIIAGLLEKKAKAPAAAPAE